MTQTITIIRGDGIGPEIMDATLHVLDAMNVGLRYEEADAGRLLRSRIKECRGFSPGAASCDDQRGRDGKDRRASPHSFVGQPGRHRHGMVLSPSVL